MTVWSYTNVTTGVRMECNDYNFLMHELVVVNGFTFPDNVDLELLVRGKLSCEVETSDGMTNAVTIEKCDGFQDYTLTPYQTSGMM